MRLARMILISAVMMVWAGAASAQSVPVTFELISTANDGTGATTSTQTHTPPLPIVGSGTIDEAAGTFSFALPAYSIDINLDDLAFPPPPPDEATITITGWGQVGTFLGGTPGPVATTSVPSGTVGCVDNTAGGIGAAICTFVAALVKGWPPVGVTPGGFGPPGAVIDITTNTITVTEPHDANAGQIQSVYVYYDAGSAIPTLSEWGMIGLTLMLLTAMIVMIRRRKDLQLPAA